MAIVSTALCSQNRPPEALDWAAQTIFKVGQRPFCGGWNGKTILCQIKVIRLIDGYQRPPEDNKTRRKIMCRLCHSANRWRWFTAEQRPPEGSLGRHTVQKNHFCLCPAITPQPSCQRKMGETANPSLFPLCQKTQANYRDVKPKSDKSTANATHTECIKKRATRCDFDLK